jgi:ParB family chromosome partitioning protein
MKGMLMSKEQVAKTKKKIGLGRGLGSLLGENNRNSAFTSDADEIELPVIESDEFKNDIIKSEKKDFRFNTENRIIFLGIERIKANKLQPRKHFDEKKLQGLALSIKQSGVIQPILVRKMDDDYYEIIAGERRWRASQKAGLTQIPTIIKKYDNNEALEVALIENIQRNDLNPIEEAEAMKQLIQKYKMTQDQLSQKLGKERSSITNLLRLLSLAPKVKENVFQGMISLGQAKVLLSISEWGEQEKLAQQIIKKNMSVRELEKTVKKIKNKDSANIAEPSEALNLKLIKGLSEELQKLLGQKVNIDYNQGKGKIKISFHSDEELNGIVNNIRQSWK